MFPNDPDGCFGEYRKHKESARGLVFPFIAEVMERLLHGLPKPLPELSWIEIDESFVKRTNVCLHLLINRSLERRSNREIGPR